MKPPRSSTVLWQSTCFECRLLQVLSVESPGWKGEGDGKDHGQPKGWWQRPLPKTMKSVSWASCRKRPEIRQLLLFIFVLKTVTVLCASTSFPKQIVWQHGNLWHALTANYSSQSIGHTNDYKFQTGWVPHSDCKDWDQHHRWTKSETTALLTLGHNLASLKVISDIVCNFFHTWESYSHLHKKLLLTVSTWIGTVCADWKFPQGFR